VVRVSPLVEAIVLESQPGMSAHFTYGGEAVAGELGKLTQCSTKLRSKEQGWLARQMQQVGGMRSLSRMAAGDASSRRRGTGGTGGNQDGAE
jgi:hypothetical protein